MLYVDELPYVVLWIDRCSPEWAEAFRSGTAELPTEHDGYPVIVRHVCGNLAEMESAPGTAAYGASEPTRSGLTGVYWALGITGALFAYAFAPEIVRALTGKRLL